MKPQLVGIGPGVHSADLEKTRSRLMKGGSWKKQRVVVLIPASESIPTKVYLSHCSLMFPPNNGVYRIAAIGMEVGEAFSNAINDVITHPVLNEWEYLLTIEHDNIPDPDALLKLLERMEEHKEFACIGGLYFTKGNGGVAQIWGDPKDALNFRPQLPDLNGGLVECCGTGMGFNLWRLGMFKDERLRRPWFKTIADKTGVGSQDLYAWSDFRKNGYRCAVDCSVKVGHYSVEEDIVY
jgi:hypothetical protein